jgi:hypothetical protein
MGEIQGFFPFGFAQGQNDEQDDSFHVFAQSVIPSEATQSELRGISQEYPKRRHFDRSLSQLYRERRSGETRFSTEVDSTGRTADSSTPLRSGRNDTLKKNECSRASLMNTT